MNINLKYCRKCKKPYDFNECPYCRELNKEVKNDRIYNGSDKRQESK